MVEEKQENRELEIQRRLEAEVFLKIWRKFKAACKIVLQQKDEKKKRYKKHLKRVENRDQLYRKRKALGRV